MEESLDSSQLDVELPLDTPRSSQRGPRQKEGGAIEDGAEAGYCQGSVCKSNFGTAVKVKVRAFLKRWHSCRTRLPAR